MHRYVRRGEKSIKIIVPMFKTSVDEQSGEERRQVFFGVGNTFDISQTDGEPLPEVDVPLLQGEAGAQLYTGLTGVASREGLQVEQVPELAGEMMGFYERGSQRIVVRLAAQLQMTKTLAHELGHHFAGHGAPEDQSPRAEQETVAESVAYVVLAHHGLDSGVRSFPYIATWSKDRKVLQQAMSTIQKVSATLIDGVQRQDAELLPHQSGEPAPEAISPI
jgi:antirestriction protein ArdC